MRDIRLDGENLGLPDCLLAARGEDDATGVHLFPRVEITGERMQEIGQFRDGLVAYGQDHAVYGFNTGCGSRKCVMIPGEEITAYQRHYIPAHCVGFGEPFPDEVVRLALVLRANSFAKGHSGVRPELCASLVNLYNAGVIPYVPQIGSVGASGDLCPLAHVSATLMGSEEQRAWYQGEFMTAKYALIAADLQPIVLKGKEAMALTNGSTFILAQAILGQADLESLLWYSNLAAALSLEAIRGETAAFDERVHLARPYPGQIQVAAEIRQLTAGSERMTHACRLVDLPAEHVKSQPNDLKVPRVQDAYSYRCYPQVAGPVREIIDRAKEALSIEANSATDNPLIFQVGEQFVAVSCGNFHGEPLGHASEQMKLAAQCLANISNSRLYALLNPESSYGLPADLAGESDLNTGLMIAQYAVAALVAECAVMCYPAKAISIPTSAGQEDHVSMASISARHMRRVIELAFAVIAWELIGAAQGITLTQKSLNDPKLGRGTSVALQVIRSAIEEMNDDRFLMADHQKMLKLIQSGALRQAVAAAL
ncbi:MAG: aromatic amino acid lyase [Patescibacteria group bacterium]|nr:aromatic amino acid lyase [Patescibacteria group bacterium]